MPQGAQTMLIPFIVIIETISNLMQPGTLAVRLTANIIAGHLLLILLGNNGPSIRHTLLTVLITAQILLLILEAAVAIIQSYVFAILRALYSRECVCVCEISISIILALQSWLNLSLFQTCPPLFSVLLLTPLVPHVHVLQIFRN